MRTAWRFQGRVASDTTGSTAIEFGIVAPIFFLMLFAIVQLSFAFFQGSTIQWAIERAVRTAMIDPGVTSEEIKTLVDEKMGTIKTPNIAFQYIIDDSGVVPLSHVTASYAVPVDIPFVSGITIPFAVDSYIPVPAEAE